MIYNLGKLEVTVTTKGEEEDGFLHFEEDGSFVIPVTEDNPYFPYEVQFKYDDTVTTEWFLTPSDTVTVNGHEFGVSVGEDGDGNPVYSSLTLTVGGDEILVYPEKKSFTSPRVGLLKAMSLQPLKEVRLNLGDALKNYTPVELTQGSADMLFEGGQVTDEDRIIWTHIDDDLGENYTISQKGSILDLSFDLDYSSISRWEMIVGKPDQLAKDNVRYIVSFNLPGSPYIRKWLDAVLLVDGKEHQPDDFYYYDYTRESRELYIRTTAAVTGDSKSANVRLSVNPSIYPTPNYAKLRVFDGSYTDAAEAAGGTDITGQLMGTGYTVSRSSDQDITFVTYDADGNATGCLPVRLYLSIGSASGPDFDNLRKRTATGTEYVVDSSTISRSVKDGITTETCTATLYKEFPANDTYYLRLYEYIKEGESALDALTGIYIGNYDTIAAAKKANAKSVKDALLSDEGYSADFSKGVTFSIFDGEDGKDQKVYKYIQIAKTGENSKQYSSSYTGLSFSGLVQEDGTHVSVYTVEKEMDSYGEGNYITLLVDKEVNLKKLAPSFSTGSGAKVYVGGSSQPEQSGKSFHDFSKGPVQYTVSAENGKASANYWIQVVQVNETEGYHLYIDSFADPEAKTTTDKQGVIHSTREILLDSYHDYRHDILLINNGSTAIPDIRTELKCDVLELDGYWTLKGEEDFSEFSTIDNSKDKDGNWITYGELANMARIRLKPKDGKTDSADISGTLTIFSGTQKLVELKLTGSIGDPTITTTELPDAVLYVPYGTMIQNNNKYRYYVPQYTLSGGSLPEGMDIKPNGELYGVPMETGTFKFRVRMQNGARTGSSRSVSKELTLVVRDNTDENVDVYARSAYMEYDLIDEIPDMWIRDTETSYVMRSIGEFVEFRYVWLDGELLTEGTDYIAESGSTKLTIMAETLKSHGTGRHTLGVEFRTKDDVFKRTSQNYYVYDTSRSSSGNGGGGGSSIGMMSSTAGTGAGNGVTPLNALAPGMTARTATPGTWEAGQNGSWFFRKAASEAGAADGWIVYNHYWYYLDADARMVTGWRRMNNNWYYFSEAQDETFGRLLTGWQTVLGKMYYFHPGDDDRMGVMYADTTTPDGFRVGIDGSRVEAAAAAETQTQAQA